MDVARRLKFGLAALVALVGTAFFAAPALADTQPDPTESNVPYLAWRGEQVRLVKCAASITGINQRADFLLVDWSGEEHALAIPQMEGGTAGFLVGSAGGDHAGQGCVAATFSSQKAGVAQIKLIVSSLPGGIGASPYTTGAGAVGFLPGGNVVGLAGTPVLKHDFLAIWMNLNPPVLSVGNPPGPLGDTPATGFPTPGAEVLTDPAGGGPNNFRVDVTGNAPLRADFRELGLGDTLQLPRDWQKLAIAYGTFFNPDNPAPGGQWDIHDNRATDEFHGGQSVCPAVSTTVAGIAAERAARTDAVDNCPETLGVGTPAGPAFPGPSLFPLPGGTNLSAITPSGTFTPAELGAFSRVWTGGRCGGAACPAIGPFDPLKPSETLLSNGTLDANDAPMPAARIDFTTTGGGFFGCVGSMTVQGPQGAGCGTTSVPGATTLGVVGTNVSIPLGNVLVPNQAAKDKHVIYSRDGKGTVSAAAPNAHNLYAPFYGRFIPSTSRAFLTPGLDPRLPANFTPNAEASGEDGPSGSVLDNTSQTCPGCPNIGTNNFNGWLVNGLYHYWDIARVLSNGALANSTCLFRFVTTFSPTGTQFPSTAPVVTRTAIARPLSSGASNVAVYTDEHGEAHVNWYPGIGFGNFNGLAANLNLGCELQNVSPMAQPVIQAIARYPYQPVTAPPLLSNTFTKTVTSLFNKQLRCAPKGTGVNDQFSQICVISAVDITGSPTPMAGEIVCFASNAELIQYYTTGIGTVLPASLGGGLVGGTLLTPAEVAALGKSGAAIQCQRLDAGGRAAVEVFGKGPSNVLVDLVDEGLIRALSFNFGSPATAIGTSEAPAVTSTATATPAQIAAVNTATPPTIKDDKGNVVPVSSNPAVKEITPNQVVPGTKKASAYRVASTPQLITPVQGKAYLLVRVNGPKGNVKIRIRLMGARTAISTIDRTIPANKLVKVKNLPKITAAVRTINVTVVS